MKLEDRLKRYSRQKREVVESVLIDYFKRESVDYKNLAKGTCKIKKKKGKEIFYYKGKRVLTLHPLERVNDEMGERLDIKVTIHYLEEKKGI